MIARVGTVAFDLDARVSALVARNGALYASTSLPSVYAARVRYAPPGDLADAREVIARGWGGCLSLAAARAGELLARGVPARVVFTAVQPGIVSPVRQYLVAPALHAIVQSAAGFEDPSALVRCFP